jgi:hypothetical protein
MKFDKYQRPAADNKKKESAHAASPVLGVCSSVPLGFPGQGIPVLGFPGPGRFVTKEGDAAIWWMCFELL